MTISKAVDDADDGTVRTALLGILEGAMNPAFGALPKRELELLVLNALVQIGHIEENPDLYTLVRSLRTTRARARALLYERELRRQDAAGLDELVKDALRRPLLQKQGDAFCLEVENPLVADHIRYLLRTLGHATDGSFSPSLVRMSLEAAAALIEHVIEKKDRESLKKALVKAGAPDKSLRGAIVGVLKKAGAKVAGAAGEALAESAAEYVAPLVDVAKGAIQVKVSALFAPDS